MPPLRQVCYESQQRIDEQRRVDLPSHRMDPDLEAPQQALALAARGEIRTGVLEAAKHGPEDFLGKLRVALLVCIGEGFLGWRSDAETRENGCFEPQPVADILESHDM